MLRGIRGAITVKQNKAEEIIAATGRLLKEMVVVNKIKIPDIASVIFSVTGEMDAAFPAEAARKLGWQFTPLLCTYEINVKGSLQKCIRVLMHVNSKKPQKELKPVYLEEAKKLREDI
ncbi:MAG: chorismate mutase [Candidatus Saganbacteria bacterium]|nr:chorismate mutase [Candidatus Saganbacteria bacterium]